MLTRIRQYVIATRPWSFTMSLISISVGTLLAAQEGVEVTRDKVQRVQLHRQLSLGGLVPEKGLERLPDGFKLFECEQAIGGKAEIPGPAFPKVAVPGVQDFLVLLTFEAPGLDPRPQVLGGDEQGQGFLRFEFIRL